MIRLLTIAVLMTGLIGCAAAPRASKMNEVSLGMSKAQVIAAIGTPDTSSAIDGVEYLVYGLHEELTGSERVSCTAISVLSLGTGAWQCRGAEDDYFVRIENGAVTAYGRVGDFDSTQVPEATINVNKEVTEND